MDATNLVSGQSESSKGYEREILTLPFDLQREPPARLAPVMCQLYQEATASEPFLELIAAIGFVYSPTARLASDQSLFRALRSDMVTTQGSDSTFFATNRYWRAERARSIGMGAVSPCDDLRSVRTIGDELLVRVWRPTEPDRKKRHIVMSANSDGREVDTVYVAPGIPLTVFPLEVGGGKQAIAERGGMARPR